MSAILRTVLERPWALQPAALSRLVESLGQDPSRAAALRLFAVDGSHQGAMRAGAVSVIPVYGLISHRSSLFGSLFGGTSVDEIRATLADELADPAVRAIVLDVDSPGGGVEGIPEFAAELRAARGGSKPIVAVANTLAASAAYWLACQADEVVVTPSGMVGSIGILAVHQEASRLLDKEGITTTLISAGQYKAEGNEFEPLTDEARASIQEGADAFLELFISDVAKGRRVTADQVRTGYGEGRALLPAQARSAGMVDRIETLDATVARLYRSTGGEVRRRARASLVPLGFEATALGQIEAVESSDEAASETDTTEPPPSAEVAPFTERLASFADEATELVAQAQERARLRAKEERPAFSTTTETALRSTRDAITALLEPVDPAPSEAVVAAVEPLVATVPVLPVAAVAPAPPRFRSDAEWMAYLKGNRTR